MQIRSRREAVGGLPWRSQLNQLRELDEPRQFLTPTEMVSRELYEITQLQKVLVDPPRQRYFPTGWPGRILTLELLARQTRAAAFARSVGQ
jgi:hypothetical protein